MRALLIPAAFAALISAAPLAFADGDAAVGSYTGTTTGIVKSIDARSDMLVLKDGSAYTLPAGPQAAHLKPGEKVKVTWDLQGGARFADHVAITG